MTASVSYLRGMDDRSANLVVALVVALADELDASNVRAAGQQAVGAAALATVHSVPGARVDGLARVLGLTGSGAVRLVDRLVGAGLLERRRDASDQRAVALHLTPAGTTAAEAIVRQRREAVERALAPLSDDQRRVLAECAEPVLAHLAGERTRADRICRFCDYAACPQPDCPVEGSVP